MKTTGWSSNSKTASAAFLTYLAAKKVLKKAPKLWTG